MTNTDNKELLDKINKVRQKEYEKLDTIAKNFRYIYTLARLYEHHIMKDPVYLYGAYPIEDAGPFDSDSEPDYHRPTGCEGCPIRDFAGHD